VDLQEAADQLYGLPAGELADFAARRTELAKQARADGDRELAGQIGKLRKPVQAAALVNLLVREQPQALADLSELAVALRDAHRHLRGPELRELSGRRQRMLGDLVKAAGKVAGRSVGEPVLDQVRATFEAAIADEAAEQAVLSGRLTAALSYSGFGAVDVSDAVAVPRRLAAVPDLPGEAQSEPEPVDRAPAERALRRAEQQHQQALDAVDGAVGELDAARAREAELAERVAKLRDQLAAAEADAGRAADRTAAAERAHRKAARALDRAADRLATARTALD